MTDVEFVRPREIVAQKPVRVVLVNGFLGAGKTTALATLAAALSARGARVGMITNDQAANLVDTASVRHAGLPVGEVAGGCFCCRFTELLDAAQTLLRGSPDYLLCEPVGSCTDMAATVLNPLRLFYRDTFRLAPFSVLLDPERVRELVLEESTTALRSEVGYIFGKQIDEADLLVLNKADTLEAAEADRLCAAMKERCGRPVLRLSALRGDGVEEWVERLGEDAPSGRRVLHDLDYDIYAAGEAALGWLNLTARVESRSPIDGRRLADVLLRELRASCAGRGEIVHLKLFLNAGDSFVRANLTRTAGEPSVVGSGASLIGPATLLLNARVQIEPGELGAMAVGAVESAARAEGVSVDIASLQCFSPSYPRPTYRMRQPAA